MFKTSALFAGLLTFCIAFPAAAQEAASDHTYTITIDLTPLMYVEAPNGTFTTVLGDALDEWAHSDFENEMCVETLGSYITGYSWEDEFADEPCEDEFIDRSYSLWDAVKVFNLLDPYA